MALTRQEIVNGLKQLGVREGTVIMAHSALSAFGEVEGGAVAVIEALIEAVGPEGTLLMPAMASEQPFRIESSPSTVGTITDVFRSYAGTTRSLHPTHSVAGIGPLVDQLIAGHIDQPTALGPQSPWGRMAQRDDAYILLLGCDQDRNTLLHCAEEAVDGAYLNPITRRYIDSEGQEQTKVLEKFPGPHRDFIGLDPLFEGAQAMNVGKIGTAVCRLMSAKQTLMLAIEALRRDPAAVLCDNPHCRDCVQQRADIKRARLANESFTLSAVIDDTGFSPSEIEQALWLVSAEGIGAIEVGPQWARALREEANVRREVAARLGGAGMEAAIIHADVPMGDELALEAAVDALNAAIEATAVFTPDYLKLPDYPRGAGDPEVSFTHAVELLEALGQAAESAGVLLLIENHADALWRDTISCDRVLTSVSSPAVAFSFNPAHFAHVGEHPFLGTYKRARAKRYTEQVMLIDGCTPPWPGYTLLAQGQGEVRELMSILRCRSFAGHFTICLKDLRGAESFACQAAEFWRSLDLM